MNDQFTESILNWKQLQSNHPTQNSIKTIGYQIELIKYNYEQIIEQT